MLHEIAEGMSYRDVRKNAFNELSRSLSLKLKEKKYKISSSIQHLTSRWRPNYVYPNKMRQLFSNVGVLGGKFEFWRTFSIKPARHKSSFWNFKVVKFAFLNAPPINDTIFSVLMPSQGVSEGQRRRVWVSKKDFMHNDSHGIFHPRENGKYPHEIMPKFISSFISSVGIFSHWSLPHTIRHCWASLLVPSHL